jgi:protein SCO1/2
MRIIVTLALLLALAAPAFGAAGDGPRSIALVDQRGARFSLDDLRGRPVMVTFVATRCTDACPIATALYSQLAARLRRAHVDATLLEVTLDPQYDTPFVMERYAQRYDGGGPAWRFASGAPGDVRAVMRAFGVTAVKDGRGIPEVHSTFAYLIDPRGKLTRTFLVSTNLVDEAMRVLTRMVALR